MNVRFSNKYLNFFMFDDFDILLLCAAHIPLYIYIFCFTSFIPFATMMFDVMARDARLTDNSPARIFV